MAPGWSFQKFNRRAQDWAIVGVVAVNGPSPGVALVNMGPVPLAGRRRSRRRWPAGPRPARRPPTPPTASTRPRTSTPAPSTGATWLEVLVRRALEEAGVP